uniref:Brevinin-2Ej n=2 Tax=Pelophylax ridibundus TaxID=8406 RepID=BR2EJ_PELRI|nr:RecName: Full=Brevinin-2Ej [Pelophylax ridibundus]
GIFLDKLKNFAKGVAQSLLNKASCKLSGQC